MYLAAAKESKRGITRVTGSNLLVEATGFSSREFKVAIADILFKSEGASNCLSFNTLK